MHGRCHDPVRCDFVRLLLEIKLQSIPKNKANLSIDMDHSDAGFDCGRKILVGNAGTTMENQRYTRRCANLTNQLDIESRVGAGAQQTVITASTGISSKIFDDVPI